MFKRRILIVDDSVVVRRSLAEALSNDSDMEVVGSAPSGRVAMMKLAIVRPDVVVLDIEMPEMDGLETLTAIRKIYTVLPVIMLNNSSDRGAAATLDALTSGAQDYVTKPDNGAADGWRIISKDLASKIRACCRDISHDLIPCSKKTIPLEPHSLSRRVDVLVIAVSTGGPNALMEIIPRFPGGFPVTVLIVQHMPPVFTKLLAQRLAAKSNITVVEGCMSQSVVPGAAWIAPGDFHMAVARDGETVRIVTSSGPRENSCRPAADVLFRSVIQVYGSHVLAVVMTGMGQDGLSGCECIRMAGGQVLVQDEASSVVWGMPSVVVKAGLADLIVPLDELSTEILSRVLKYRPSNVHLYANDRTTV